MRCVVRRTSRRGVSSKVVRGARLGTIDAYIDAGSCGVMVRENAHLNPESKEDEPEL